MKKGLFIVLCVLLMLCTGVACAEGCGDHMRNCSESVCSTCGVEYTGDVVRHPTPVQKYDENVHWTECGDCGETINKKMNHQSTCAAPDVCSYCGAPYASTVPVHVSFVMKSDSDRHWQECEGCGEKEIISGHIAACKNPGVCRYCNQPYSGNSIEHRHDTNYSSDAQYHWNVCLDCGEETIKLSHAVLCTNPGVCFICGVTYNTSQLSHYTDANNFKTDATTHWRICLECGAKTWEEPHVAYCDNPGVCRTCKTSFDGQVRHEYNHEKQQKDDNTHWYVCLDCGVRVNEAKHTAPCTAANACEKCGHTGGTIQVSHNTDGKDYQFDDDRHWKVCGDCGGEVGESHSRTDNGPCGVCGAPAIEPECTHAKTVWEEVTPATCKEQGSKKQVCSACGEVTANEAIPMLNHKYVKSITKEGTCTEGPELRFTCSECGTFYVEHPEAAGHVYESGVCTVCGEKEAAFGDDAVYVFAQDVVVSETAKLIVKDCTEEIAQEEMPETIKQAVKVLRVTLVENETEAVLPGLVEIQLPCTEEMLAQLSETKLMFLADNGEVKEIEYQIQENMIVFSIDTNGVYAFIPSEK